MATDALLIYTMLKRAIHHSNPVTAMFDVHLFLTPVVNLVKESL